MSSYVDTGATIINPILATGYESRRPARNIVHEIFDTTSVDVTLRPAGLRTGTLELLFADEASSKAAEDAIAAAGVMTFGDTDVTTVDMSFIVPAGGDITRTLHDSRTAWLVTFGYHEVTP
jgi:hypothetical protein